MKLVFAIIFFIFISVKKNSAAHINQDHESCGIMSESAGLVQGGEKSKAVQFPWITTIFTRYMGVYLFAGSGSIISSKHVLCAANSVAHENYDEETGELDEKDNYIPYVGQNVKLILGSINYKGLNESYSQTINRVDKVILHPNLKGTKPRIANIAILKLKTPINFTQYIKPVCLWSFDNSRAISNQQIFYAVGYGVDDSGSVSIIRKHMALTKQNDEFCKRFYRKGFRSGDFFCAKGNGETPCKNDKPLYTKIDGQWYLKAMSSMFRIFKNNTCSLRAPVLYEDLGLYSSWIQQQVLLN